MSMVSLSLSRAFAIGTVLLLATAGTAVAQAPAPAPLAYPVPQLTLAEARAIIEGAIAYARESNMRMAVAVIDHAGNIVSSDRMDGAALQNIRFAEGKAFASALYRQTTEALGELYKTRPDRYQYVSWEDLSRGRWSAARPRGRPRRRGRRGRIAARRRREICPGGDRRLDEIPGHHEEVAPMRVSRSELFRCGRRPERARLLPAD